MAGPAHQKDRRISEQQELREPARVHQVGINNRGMMKTKDSKRKWMWWFLGVVLALQLYFVRELLAAFALFALGFAAIAFVVVSLYMLQKVWEAGVQRVADSRHPVVDLARRGVNAVEDLARRPLRRPGSAAAR
jgi:hypothetical protein